MTVQGNLRQPLATWMERASIARQGIANDCQPGPSPMTPMQSCDVMQPHYPIRMCIWHSRPQRTSQAHNITPCHLAKCQATASAAREGDVKGLTSSHTVASYRCSGPTFPPSMTPGGGLAAQQRAPALQQRTAWPSRSSSSRRSPTRAGKTIPGPAAPSRRHSWSASSRTCGLPHFQPCAFL